MKDEFEVKSQSSAKRTRRVEESYQDMMKDDGIQILAKLLQIDVMDQLTIVSIVLGKLIFDVHEGVAKKELNLDRHKDKEAFRESFDKTTKILKELDGIVDNYTEEKELSKEHLEFVATLFSSMMNAVAEKSEVGFF